MLRIICLTMFVASSAGAFERPGTRGSGMDQAGLDAAVLAEPPQEVKSPAEANMELFLLIGQSNMAGRGQIEPADRQPIARVFALGKDGSWAPAVDPVHFDKPYAGSGLARPFASYLIAAAPSAAIGLIPCAVGGTGLDEWAPGGKLYTDAVARARVAMKSGRLRAILWHQGESDSADERLASSYRDRWMRMIQSLRRELGAPETPVIVGQLGEFQYMENGGTSKFARIVNEQLALIPLYVDHAVFVSSSGLKDKGDHVHFNRESLGELGRRYALAYLSLDPNWSAR